ncbi:BTB/POZ domain-containing protein At5g67385 [Phalaenopsis equestris]|uniref:BTB/POZ domain-containing protein At5g67385 n=1 Tax=Phalaenopsis equestris TaxID=78828 RepID=UPI0009E5CF0D|nr:BTB/POZ domain-containing protein At5g67385 [Phalaenopsis equestris]
MLSIDQVNPSSLTSITKKQYPLSAAMKRTSDWIFAQDLPCDITVQAGGAAFSLHKFPLLSKCGYIKKLLSETNETKQHSIEIPDIPGGSEAFELAVKFCYGINFEINTENVAMLRCASEFLEMTEEVSVGNLLSRTEAYFEEVVLISLSGSVTVLHKSEELLPMAEKVKLVSRCIDAIAYLACSNSQFSTSSKADSSHESLSSSTSQTRAIMDWWAEELIVLRIDTFQRVLMALKSRGFKQHALGPVIMLYAQNSLRGLDIFGGGRKKIEPKQEHEKRVVLETIVGLLPTEKNTISVSFLSMLLRAAIYLETTVACRLDLEKKISLQLAHAALDDLLIPSFSFDGDILFDVDTIQRIFMNYLQNENELSQLGYNADEDYLSPPHGDIERVGRLMESYLAEIASDPNLGIAKFASFAELIPEQAKANEDDMYRAIDIYLKAHQSLTEAERKKICSMMDSQRLSREACAHAAQNDRLPVQTVVQVLFYEQQRIRDSTPPNFIGGGDSPVPLHKSGYLSDHHDSTHELSRLKSENDSLKLELVRMRMQMKENGKPAPATKMASADKPPLPKKSFMSSVSKKLSQLYTFVRSETLKEQGEKTRMKPQKNRRYSIS